MSTRTPCRSCTCTTNQDVVNISCICSRNLIALTIMYIFAQIAVLCGWQKEITSLGISLLYFSGIICNLHMIGQANRQYLVENVSCGKCLIWILHETKRVLTRFGTGIVQFVEWSSLFLKSLRLCLKKSTQMVTRRCGINTPSPYVQTGKSFKSMAQEKANSEPMRGTSRPPSRCGVHGQIALKTPELFKNKIYKTRRTLINAQD